MISFIVQARIGSTRLPNKILLPFYKGKSILELMIDKLKQVNDTNIIIATSVNPNCDVLERIAKNNGVKCFRGPENDVLQRFINAAEKYNAYKIIRVCSDNPFLELASIQKLVDKAVSQDSADYISFNINGGPSIKTHYGFWTEYVTLDALKRVNQLTNEPLYHEHVTNFIYTNPNYFNIQWINGPEIIKTHPNIRLTIDTMDDFKNAQSIFAEICIKNLYPTIDEIVDYLDSHQEYYCTMKKQIEKNNK